MEWLSEHLEAVVAIATLFAGLIFHAIKQHFEVAQLKKQMAEHLEGADDVKERLVRVETKMDLLLQKNGIKTTD